MAEKSRIRNTASHTGIETADLVAPATASTERPTEREDRETAQCPPPVRVSRPSHTPYHAVNIFTVKNMRKQ